MLGPSDRVWRGAFAPRAVGLFRLLQSHLILRARDRTKVLIDLGEIRALDGRPDGVSWTVDLENPRHRLALDNQALATSSGGNTRFETSGRHHHLLDPLSGASPNAYRRVTVISSEVVTADAVSIS